MNPELEKFVLDEKFVSWVLNPEGVYAEYWNQYFMEQPHEKPIAEEAAVFIKQLHQTEQENYTAVKADVLQSTWKNIENELRTSGQEVTINNKNRSKLYRIAGIAATLLIATATIFFTGGNRTKNKAQAISRVELQDNSKQIITNQTNHFRLVHLSDGTAINLAPNSSIATEKLFTGQQREVTLKGKAFFEVAKNPAMPFYVYTGSVVTRVVGTSFSIVTKSGTNDVTVSVKTGKVMVYKKGKEQVPSAIAILLPAQQCSYSAAKDTIEKRMLARPEDAVIQQINEKTQRFERASIPTLLTTISRRFGVEIQYNASDFQGTDITITLQTSQSLESMLHVICKTINASYRIEESKIFFTKNK